MSITSTIFFKMFVLNSILFVSHLLVPRGILQFEDVLCQQLPSVESYHQYLRTTRKKNTVRAIGVSVEIPRGGGGRAGAVIKTLASHQSAPGSISTLMKVGDLGADSGDEEFFFRRFRLFFSSFPLSAPGSLKS